MADRTWNGVDARVLDEEWSDCATIVALTLLIRCPTQHGAFHLPRGYLHRRWSQLFTADQVDAAIDELVADGIIRLYREGRVVWIVKKWKRSRYATTANNYKGCIADLSLQYPEVLSDFVAAYADLVGTKSDLVELSSPKVPLSRTTDPDPDPEDNKTPLPPLPVEPPPAPKPESRKRQIEPAKYLQLQLRINEFITEQIKLNNTPHSGIDNLHPDGARELRLLVEQDGMPEADIMPCLEWAWRHRLPNGDYYGTVLLSLRGWRGGRKDGDLGKFWRAHKMWRKETGGLKQPDPAMTEAERQAWIAARQQELADEEKRRDVRRQLEAERAQRQASQERETEAEIEARRQAGLAKLRELTPAEVQP